MAADGGFSPVSTGEKGQASGAVGPGSNTGQKGGALIDYFTVTLSAAVLEEKRLTDVRMLLSALFGFRGEVINTPIRDKVWQFYRSSCYLLDREGEMVGRMGFDGNGDTVCVSLSGAGTRWVKSWEHVAAKVTELRGNLSRVDVAYDDYDGEVLDVHDLRARAHKGEFWQGGRPPEFSFKSDEGSGKGSTLYVGAKGHKQLCAYEKGKQLGMPESKWVRAEVRLYGKHVALSVDVLTNPLDHLRGAYDVLGALLHGVCTRLKTIKRAVVVSATAAQRWARRQVGPTLHVFREAFGPKWIEWLEEHVVREGRPGRFRGIAKGDQLSQFIRSELCPSSP